MIEDIIAVSLDHIPEVLIMLQSGKLLGER
jgi:hypothetical protein